MFNDFGVLEFFDFVTISITVSISRFFVVFFVNVILVIHLSYYITVYLKDVKSCIWFGYLCVQGGDVRVSTGRCFIFVMKYIKLTYIQAGIMFISFVVVECLYLIHWKRCKNVGRGWIRGGGKGFQCLLACVHQCVTAVKREDTVTQTWQLQECPYCSLC